MLWKDFVANESCDGCPLLENEICPGEFCCYGGEPVEPPCHTFNDDTDLDKWVQDYYKSLRAEEARQEEKKQRERQRKERAEKAADTRRAVRAYCVAEISEVKRAEKELQTQREAERLATSFAEAFNLANEMSQSDGRVTISGVSAEIERLEAKVASAKEKYEAKRKEFYAKRKLKGAF